VDVPWGFVAGWAGFLAGAAGAVLTGWLSERVGLTPLPAADPADAGGCRECGRPAARACSRCGRPYCDAHLSWRLSWAPGTSSDGGYGLGQHERCRGCSPARPLIAASCLFVLGGFVALCAGVLSFPQP
jgi:hypothetical protein